MTMNFDDKINLVIRYVKLGWIPIPIYPGTKKPYMELLPKVNGRSSWRALLEDPPQKADIETWIRWDPSTCIALATGSHTRLIVIDIDYHECLPEEGIYLPPTLRVQSYRGEHLYYFAEDWIVNSQNHPWGEVKAEGGYVMAPPSRHPEEGWYYEFSEEPSLEAMANFEDVVLPSFPSRTRNRGWGYSFLSVPNTISSSTNTVKEEADQKMRDPSFCLKLVQDLGADVEHIGKAFRCIIPGHSETKPSAALWQMRDEPIIYYDFHGRESTNLLFLPDVYAAVKNNYFKELKEGERYLWWLRILYEYDVIEVPHIKYYDLPGNLPPSFYRLYDGIILMYRLRKIYKPEQEYMPCSYRFLEHWIGLKGVESRRRALEYLKKNGYLLSDRKIVNSKNTWDTPLYQLVKPS